MRDYRVRFAIAKQIDHRTVSLSAKHDDNASAFLRCLLAARVIIHAHARARTSLTRAREHVKRHPRGNPSPSFLVAACISVRWPITGATAHTRILIILRAGHLSRHKRARVRALFIPPCVLNGQRYFATPRHAMPRIRARGRGSLSRGGPEERAGAGRVSARVYARGHSRAGTRPAFQPYWWSFSACLPHSSPTSFFPIALRILSSHAEVSSMQRLDAVRCGRSMGTNASIELHVRLILSIHNSFTPSHPRIISKSNTFCEDSFQDI